MSIASNFPAIKPTLLLDFANTEQLDPRITFTRASTATYYGTQTAKAEENLLIRSQEFDDSAWQKIGITVTGNNTTAPDGTTTAELLAETADTSTHQLSGSAGNNRHTTTSGLTYAFSVFLKKGVGATAPDIVQVSWSGAGFASDVYVNFNLSTGAVATAGAGVLSSAITSAGGGWYRCSFTATSNASGATSTAVFFTNNNGSATRAPSYAGATTADVYAWGAQLEQRASVTAYTPTTTQPITNYIPQLLTAASGVARFDHNPTTFESLGLEIEEQRTNLLTYSEQFNNAAWTKTRSSITANTIVAPDGTLTGDKLVEDTTASNTHGVNQTFSFSTGSYVYSIYAKAGERTFLQPFRSSINIDSFTHIFNLAAGTVSGTGATIVSVGNGWYRCIGVVNVNTAHSGSIIFGLNNGTSNSYTGDGYSGVFIWGAQLEAGAFPTSYIPTVASQVTRAADAASMTGTNFSSWYRQDQGTLYCESATVSLAADRGIWAIGNSSLGFAAANTMFEVYASGALGQRAVSVLSNGVSQCGTFAPAGVMQTINTFTKGAFTYAFNSFAITVSAATPATDSVALVPQGATGMSIGDLANGWSGAGVVKLNGTIKKLAYYPLRVTNAQLQALTS